MSNYLFGDEGEFRGFGSIEDIEAIKESMQDVLMDSSCALVPNSAACQVVKQKLKIHLDNLYSAAGGELKSIAGKIPVLANALSGSQNPLAVLSQAENLSKFISGGDLERSAYKVFYSHGVAGLDMISSMVNFNPSLGTVFDAVKTGATQFPEIARWVDKVTEQGIDDAGVGDALNVISRAAVSAQSIVGSFSQEAAAGMQKAISYLNVASGCISSISAGMAAGPWGAAAGGVMCGIQVLGQVFSDLNNKPTVQTVDEAVFKPTEGWSEIIAKDAERLAALLRYVYNVPSFKWIVDRYTSNTGLKNNMTGKGISLSYYPPKGSSEPVPGFSWRTLAHVARAICGGGYKEWPLVGPYTPMEMAVYGYRFYDGWVSYLDVSRIVAGGRSAAADGTSGGVDSAATVMLLEWVNFFAAVTMENPKEISLLLAKHALPVRYYHQKFDSRQWGRKDDFCGGNVTSAANLHGIEDYLCAGAIRLVSAFSYMLLQYHRGERVTPEWGPSTLKVDNDLVRGLPSLGSDPSGLMYIPVSPRTKVSGGRYSFDGVEPQQLAMEIRTRRSRFSPIEEKAKDSANSAMGKVHSAAGAFKRQLLEQEYGVGSLKPVIDPRYKTATMLTPEQKAAMVKSGAVSAPKSGGAGGVILVGAAALLALKFLK